MTSQTCTVSQFTTNAIGGTFGSYSSGTYITLDSDANGIMETYNYVGLQTSTGGCIGTLLSFRTPELFDLRRYAGSSGISINICSPTNGQQYVKYS